jgi:hypothetical protein
VKSGTVKPVRCAIYTPVSTEHGLEQDFNSLDAQHDAAQAYIRSQAHAGWTLIRARYDDGGYSGGSTAGKSPSRRHAKPNDEPQIQGSSSTCFARRAASRQSGSCPSAS